MANIAAQILERKRAAQATQPIVVPTTKPVEETKGEKPEARTERELPAQETRAETQEQQQQLSAVQAAPRTETTKPVKAERLDDYLRGYPTLQSVKDSPIWTLLSLRERIELGRLYTRTVQQSGAPATIPSASRSDNNNQNTASTSPLEQYNSFAKFASSPEYAKLTIVDRAYWSREFAKRSQQEAMYATMAQRDLETAIAAEERKKTLAAEADLKARAEEKHQAFALDIQLNERQQMGVEYALAGKSFVFTGSAGTGKTTGCREIAKAYLKRGGLGFHTFKMESGEKVSSHGIAFISYTRRASANIRRALHKDPELERELAANVVTVHRFLEYEPEFYFDALKQKDSMRFIPKRTAQRMLDCKVIVIEESSMLGLDLWEKLFAAMRPGTIVVFVGDLNQLPPVFGKSILNYALAQLPVIELTEVYRQALDSGIIQNALRILKGEAPVENKDTQIVTSKANVQIGQERMAKSLGSFFHRIWQAKDYDPEQDIILSPWNKQPCGTDNLNAWISQFLGEQRNAMVYEVLAGRRKLYLAVGDRVMYEKRDGIISAIRHNAQYLGKAPQPASTSLTRFGLRKLGSDADSSDFDLAATPGYENLNIDEVPDEEKKLQSSHVIELILDDGSKEVLSAVGDFADQVFSLGYCLTVHKAQGCEWRKVYVILHKDHTLGGFLTRELVYTAATRAREKLIFIAEPSVLSTLVSQQRIRGNTLEEKIQSINSGASNIGSYPVIKR